MNTIPLIFNEREIKRTVVGGSEHAAGEKNIPVSAVLLNRGARHYRSRIFENLDKYGFASVVSIELAGENYDIENLARLFPSVKFIIPQERLTVGEMINVGIGESLAPHVLVIWNDAGIGAGVFTPRFFSGLSGECLCTAPSLFNRKSQPLPAQMSPHAEKGSFTVVPSLCYQEGCRTLYPFDFMGLYNREKFMRLGGFDYTIQSPYWQNLDFFTRAWLWGESVSTYSALRIQYDGEVQEEDITPDESYLRFFLKNIAPQFNLDHAEIPAAKFFGFYKHSSCSFFDALAHFSDARRWVKKNKYRFKYDVKFLTEMWGKENT